MSRVFLLVLICFVVGCGPPQDKIIQTPPKEGERFEPVVVTLSNGEPSHIVVQHVLIAFAGSIEKDITRDKSEAESLAKEVLAKAQAGDDFGALVEEFTDDSPPGIYRMANFDQQSFMKTQVVEDMVFPRGKMVAAFGDVGFPLEVGEVGLAPFDKTKSPYGWHVVKRIK